MNDRTRSILERVAKGVYCRHSGKLYVWHQCVFCQREPDSRHDDDCPTILARQILEELEERKQE